MPKLNQIIAIVNGKKTKVEKAITDIYHKIQKPTLFDGLIKTYRPMDEEGDSMPPEKKNIQYKSDQAIEDFSKHLVDLINVVATQDYANCEATADIMIDDKILVKSVPVTHLLFLEKQLNHVLTFAKKLPVLDPGETWSKDDAVNAYRSESQVTNRMKKVMKNHVKAEATDKHPAQVEVYNEEVKVGEWTTIKHSSAVKQSDKQVMIDRTLVLIDAVKVAREEANNKDVESREIASSLMDYVFKGVIHQ